MEIREVDLIGRTDGLEAINRLISSGSLVQYAARKKQQQKRANPKNETGKQIGNNVDLSGTDGWKRFT